LEAIQNDAGATIEEYEAKIDELQEQNQKDQSIFNDRSAEWEVFKVNQ